MFKISEFSKLCQVSTKTLRYYDQIGLLKPSHVDAVNGYRYYSADQLHRVNRIYALKDLGFTLEQIIPILDQDLPADRIRSMLLHKEAELRSHLEKEQARLQRIQSRLVQLERDRSNGPELEVSFKEIEESWIASIREVTSKANVFRLWEELKQYAQQQGLPEPKTWMVLWHQCAECEDHVDLEVAIPLARQTQSTERVNVRLLEPTSAACLVHECQPQGYCNVSAKLGIFLEEHGYAIHPDHPSREIYVSSLDGTTFMAEMQMPISVGMGRV
ncbi:MAG TPA: MerR family transcriptional regulator [Candidatus Bathyarchaeia archaeon]|nr:MerR family transcriptional regulator [Candidatus Bathyarchaeia archaeon]